MITGVEIDMIVSDSLKALALYEKIFTIERIDVTDFPKGESEVILSIYGTKFHLLDENPQFEMIAPKPGDPMTIWFNVMVRGYCPDLSKSNQCGVHRGAANHRSTRLWRFECDVQ